MNLNRIEEIQKETFYPDSISVQQALLKVWNEVMQEQIEEFESRKKSEIPIFNESSISWFWNEISEILPFSVDSETALKLYEAFKKAKEMHKEEVIEAWDNAAIDATYGNKFSSPYQYYNETFEGGNK